MRSAIRIVGLVMLLLPGAAWAADQATCIAYASGATARAVQDAMAVCGYSGDAWNPGDYIGHLNWCLGASAETVAAETRNRTAAIEKCDRCKGYAQTAVSPYSVRPRGRAPVATPLEWDELDDPAFRPDGWTIADIPTRLGEREDPWASMHRHARSLVNAPRGHRENETTSRTVGPREAPWKTPSYTSMNSPGDSCARLPPCMSARMPKTWCRTPFFARCVRVMDSAETRRR